MIKIKEFDYPEFTLVPDLEIHVLYEISNPD